MTKKITGWVNNVVDFMKGILGIQSPSKLCEAKGKEIADLVRDNYENYA